MRFDTFVRLLAARVGSEFNASHYLSTFKPEFTTNMKYISELIPDVSQRTVIYDGATSAPPSLESSGYMMTSTLL